MRAVDIRAFATDRHRTVDDYPYGGGPGMVMRPGPLVEAIESVRRPASRVILLTPTGCAFKQSIAHDLAREAHLVLVCGRYEGIDERVRLMSRRRGVVDRRLRADQRRAGGDGGAGRGRALAAGRAEHERRLARRVARFGAARISRSTRGPPTTAACACPTFCCRATTRRSAAWRRRQALERTRERRPELLTPEQLAELGNAPSRSGPED